jgi:hypothetical protein
VYHFCELFSSSLLAYQPDTSWQTFQCGEVLDYLLVVIQASRCSSLLAALQPCRPYTEYQRRHVFLAK